VSKTDGLISDDFAGSRLGGWQPVVVEKRQPTNAQKTKIQTGPALARVDQLAAASTVVSHST